MSAIEYHEAAEFSRTSVSYFLEQVRRYRKQGMKKAARQVLGAAKDARRRRRFFLAGWLLRPAG